jgi:VWFA-related protein
MQGIKQPVALLFRAICFFGILLAMLFSSTAPALAYAPSSLVVPRDSGQLNVHIQQLVPVPNVPNQLVAYVSVIDATGHPVAGLAKDKVAVTVDGKPASLQDITEVTDVSEPITAAILLDTSLSMGQDDKLPNAKAAIKAFVGSLNADDQIAFYQISGDGPKGVKRLLNFTTDHTQINAIVDPLHAGGKAPIFDALYQAAQDMASPSLKGRKLIVLQTDQIDDSSIHSLQQALDLLEQVHLPAYTIGLDTTETSQMILKQIAHDTGGSSFSNPDSTVLAASYQTILSQFRDAYRLTVQTPEAFTVGRHQVQVQISYQNQTYTDPSPTDPNPPSFVIPETALSLQLSLAPGTQVSGAVSMALNVVGDTLPMQIVTVTIDGKPFATLHGTGPHFELPVWNTRYVWPGIHTIHITATDVAGNSAKPPLDVQIRVGIEWGYWTGLLIDLLLIVLVVIVLRFARFRFLGSQLEGVLVVRTLDERRAEIELGHDVKGSRLRLRITPKGVVMGAYPPWKKFPFVAATKPAAEKPAAESTTTEAPAAEKPSTEIVKVTKKTTAKAPKKVQKKVTALVYVKVEKENEKGVKSRLVMPYFHQKGKKKPFELSDKWKKKVGNYIVEFSE